MYYKILEKTDFNLSKYLFQKSDVFISYTVRIYFFIMIKILLYYVKYYIRKM